MGDHVKWVLIAAVAAVVVTMPGGARAEDEAPKKAPKGWNANPLGAFPADYQRGTKGRLAWTGLKFDRLGHNGDVVDLAWTEDGKGIVSCGQGGLLRRWDGSSGDGSHGMSAGSDWTGHVSANGGGSHFALYCRDPNSKGKGPNGRVTFHDAKTGVVNLHVTGLHLSDIAWMPDGKHVLGASFFDRVYVWNAVEKGVKTRTIPIVIEGQGGPSCVAAAPNGEWIVVGDQTGAARVIDFESGKERLELEAGPDYVLDVAISPDGSRIVTLDQRAGVKIWNASTGKEQGSIGDRWHKRWIDISPDGQTLLTGSGAGVGLWDLATREQLAWNKEQGGKCGAFSPDGSRVAVGRGMAVRLLSADDLAPVGTADTQTPPPYVGSVARNGAWALGALDKKEVGIFDTERESLIARAPVRSRGPVCVSDDLRWIARDGGRGSIELWDLKKKKRGPSLKTGGRRRPGFTELVPVRFSPNGKELLAVQLASDFDEAAKPKLLRWSVRTGKLLSELELPARAVHIGPRGERALATTGEGTANVVDLRKGKTEFTLPGGAPVAFVGTGGWAVVGAPGVLFQPDGVIGDVGGKSRVVGYVKDSPGAIYRLDKSADPKTATKLQPGPAVVSHFAATEAGPWVVGVGRRLAGEHGKAGWSQGPEGRKEFTAVGPPRLWLWHMHTGALLDDIALPHRGRDPVRQVVVHASRVLVVSGGAILEYAIGD